jgi:hypothetical protein
MKSFKAYITEYTAKSWSKYHDIQGTDFVKPKVKVLKLPTKNVTDNDLIYAQLMLDTLESYAYADLTFPGAMRKHNMWFTKYSNMAKVYGTENDAGDHLSVMRKVNDMMSERSKNYKLKGKEWKTSKQSKAWDTWQAEQEKIYPEQF